MKVYNLCCDQDHRFEGWFSSEQDFLSQSEHHQIACPTCDSPTIRKLLSAPRLNLSHAAATGKSTVSREAREDNAMKQNAAFLEMAHYVIKNTEDVGERFTEEARRIHYKEVPTHAIRGIASASQREELAEEGIEVVELALPTRLTQPLQ